MPDTSKIVSVKDAVAAIRSGDRIMVGSFGNAGYPENLVEAMTASDLKDLTIISNDLGSPGIGLGKFLANGQIKALIGNYYNWNPDVARAYNAGEIDVCLVPQGSFAEAIRAAGVGIAAFFTPTAAGTELGKEKETRDFNGRPHVLGHAIHADVAWIKAYKADELGNLVYYKTARNFNPLMAMAAALVAEVDDVVPVGSLDPECVVTPHLFVNMIIKKGEEMKEIVPGDIARARIARRIASEFMGRDRTMIINLGVGIRPWWPISSGAIGSSSRRKTA